MAKLVRVSDDSGATWYDIPGPSASLAVDGEAIDDTILGQTWQSEFTGLLNWSVESEGYYKGVAGYCATILSNGTPVTTTGEAMSQVTGQVYRINDANKEIWDRTATITVYDGVTDVTSSVAEFDYLFGKVTFDSGYTVVGAITVDVDYIPVAAFGKPQSFTLTQTSNALDTSDLPTTCGNNGFRTYAPGLRTVTVDIEGIFDATEDFNQDLIDRNEYILEISADGSTKKSLCRGFFRLTSKNQSGSVGDNEIESVTFSLNVPSASYIPFGWDHENDTTLSTAIIKTLDAFLEETTLDVQYLPNGVGGAGGQTGDCIVTDVTLTNSIDSLPAFTLSYQGTGALADV